MSDEATTKPSLRHKAVEELKEMLALTAYLYVSLGSIILLKSAILRDVGDRLHESGASRSSRPWSSPSSCCSAERRNSVSDTSHQPLIWPTLHMALMFLILLLILTTLEELLVGAIHGRPMSKSLTHIVGPSLYVGFATCLVMFLILVPYCAFKTLGGVLGDQYLVRMLLVERLDNGEPVAQTEKK